MPRRKKLPDCSIIKRMYIDLEMSMLDIANVYDVTRAGVSDKMKKCQIHARTKSEARLLALEKNKFDIFPKRFIKHFFWEINEQTAWALGVFFACGVIVEGTIGLTVSNKKMWVMKNLAEMMDFGEFEWDGVDWEAGKTITLSSVEMVRRLRELGFPEKKREDFSLPRIPGQYINSFVLGYYQRRGFVSYSQQFLEEIARWLVENEISEVAQVVGEHGEYRINTNDSIEYFLLENKYA